MLALKEVAAIYMRLIVRQQTEIEALRLMLVEGEVAEEIINAEVEKRLDDPEITKLAKKIIETEHYDGLQEAIGGVASCVDFMERLKHITGPSN